MVAVSITGVPVLVIITPDFAVIFALIISPILTLGSTLSVVIIYIIIMSEISVVIWPAIILAAIEAFMFL